MHQRAIVCTMCGGKFFPASLGFHQKVCAKKQGYILLPCPYCSEEVPKPELDEHMKKTCKKAPKQQKKNAGTAGENRFVGGAVKDLSELLDDQGRMQCSVCQRWFLQDRIGKHQNICRAIEAKHQGKPQPVFDSFKQRQFDPLIRPAAQAASELHRAGPSPDATASIPAARSSYGGMPEALDEAHKPAAPSSRCSRASPVGGKGALTVSNRAARHAAESKPSSPVSGKEQPRERETARGSTSRLAPAISGNRRHSSSRRSSATTSASPTGLRPPSGAAARSLSQGTLVAREKERTPTARGDARSSPATRHPASRSPRLGHEGELGSASHMQVAGSAGKSPRRGTGRETAPRSSLGGGCPELPSPSTGSGSRLAGRAASRPSAPFLSSARGETSHGGLGGGGAILDTNESSMDNPLAYPTYPGGHYDATGSTRGFQDASLRMQGSLMEMQRRQPMAGSARAGSGGGILPTNETSADNPLAYPSYYRRGNGSFQAR
ncbi:hypothetical protein BESB_074640 [Besnoitia besnoiti]|uniref:C2HC/C3H-type domain-containing protein n=1 Tax=Besnoitia besnoiti TaxID=94643 RepID=A0A2A9MG06_BESBE|nr:uncharacterized protein BESB_074640 [Besnoitia besnoiti]PFH34312.1 hypothetical protein BESB_074640 [Besnoitia besnoiti]